VVAALGEILVDLGTTIVIAYGGWLALKGELTAGMGCFPVGTRAATERIMHLYLTARHFDLTEPIREHVQRHIVSAVQEHADPHDLNRIEVQLYKGQRDASCGCHVLVQLPNHRDLNVTEEGKDLYAAIDLAQKRLVRALVENRQRDQTTQRRPKKFSWDRIARVLRSAR
jgi:ribosomal subunit interface protein